MKQQFNFVDAPERYQGDNATIYTADNGNGYVENKELHICGNYHYVYKFDGNPVGWYMKNPDDGIDRYLGEGASPSVVVDNISVSDAAYFASIQYVQPETPKKGKKQ